MTKYKMGKAMSVSMLETERKKEEKMKKSKPNYPVEMTAQLARTEDVGMKREIVESYMGALYYIFGIKRKAWRDWLNYEENMNLPNGERA